MARKRFTEREVVGIVARQLGIFNLPFNGPFASIMCPICDNPIVTSEIPTIERDHEQAIGLGGEDTPEACRFVHSWCHADKTHTEDRPRMHKADRQGGGRGSQVARRAKRGGSSIQGRAMDGTVESGIKKRFDGTVERR